MNTNVDQALRHIFGVSGEEIRRSNACYGLPMAYFNNFIRVIDRSGVVEFIERLQQEQGRKDSGPKRVVPLRAVLTVLLINNYWGFGSLYTEIEKTLRYRLSPEQRDAVGIRSTNADTQKWYHAARRTLSGSLLALDPWHLTKKHKKLTKEEVAQAHASRDVSRKYHANTVMNMLLKATVELLPKSYLEKYDGSMALDATLIPTGKKANFFGSGVGTNVEFAAGIYGRDKGHYKKYDYGYEVDTNVMVSPSDPNWGFDLITSSYVHRPSRIKESGLVCVQAHHEMFPDPGMILVDRAYSGLVPFRFQEPIRRLGYQTAYKYKVTDLGLQTKIEGFPIILAEGNLYLATMPWHLVNLHKIAAGEEKLPNGGDLTPELFDQYLSERSKYRLKPHGIPDAHAHQRFTFPKNIAQLDHRDYTTKKTAPVPVVPGSFMLKPTEKVIKHIQKHEYMSPEWKHLTGQRNRVEASNREAKRVTGANLHEYGKRLGRGKTFQTIAIAFALAAENIRRIIRGVKKYIANQEPKVAPKSRSSRRLYMDGTKAPTISKTSRSTALVVEHNPPQRT